MALVIHSFLVCLCTKTSFFVFTRHDRSLCIRNPGEQLQQLQCWTPHLELKHIGIQEKKKSSLLGLCDASNTTFPQYCICYTACLQGRQAGPLMLHLVFAHKVFGILVKNKHFVAHGKSRSKVCLKCSKALRLNAEFHNYPKVSHNSYVRSLGRSFWPSFRPSTVNISCARDNLLQKHHHIQ